MPLRSVLTSIGVWTARPIAFWVWGLYIAAWLVFSPENLRFHELATMFTWLMTLFIQRSEHRDTQAIHAKLDELLRADRNASDRLTEIDKKEPETIEEHRERENAGR